MTVNKTIFENELEYRESEYLNGKIVPHAHFAPNQKGNEMSVIKIHETM